MISRTHTVSDSRVSVTVTVSQDANKASLDVVVKFFDDDFDDIGLEYQFQHDGVSVSENILVLKNDNRWNPNSKRFSISRDETRILLPDNQYRFTILEFSLWYGPDNPLFSGPTNNDITIRSTLTDNTPSGA